MIRNAAFLVHHRFARLTYRERCNAPTDGRSRKHQ